MLLKTLYIKKEIDFVGSISLVGRINPVGFLDSMRIAAVELNHPLELS